MDLRLLFPAAGLWLGVAATFFVTGQDSDPVSRYSHSQLVFMVLVVAVVLLVVVITYFWRVRSGEIGSQVFRARVIFVSFIILGCFVTALQVSAQTSEPLAGWINQKPIAQISGVISTESQTRATSTAAVWKSPEVQVVTLATDVITVGEVAYQIQVPLTVEIEVEVDVPPPGTSVVITGKLGQSYRYGNFAAGVSSVSSIEVIAAPGFIDLLAHTMRAGLRSALSGVNERGGSLVAGLAIGDESALPSELKDQMRLSGLAHLTAVSGETVC